MNFKALRTVFFILSLGLVAPTFGLDAGVANAKEVVKKGTKTKAKSAPKSKAKVTPKKNVAKKAATKKGAKVTAPKTTAKVKAQPKTTTKPGLKSPEAIKAEVTAVKPVTTTKPVTTKPAVTAPAVTEPVLTETQFPNEETATGPWIEMFVLFVLISVGAFVVYRRKKSAGAPAASKDEFNMSRPETAFGSSLNSLDLDKSKTGAQPLTGAQTTSSSKFSKHG